MGQCSRISAANRFIEAFGPKILPHVDMKGAILKVGRVYLGSREGSGEEVVVCADLEMEGPNGIIFLHVELSDEGVLYDPEYTFDDDDAAGLSNAYGIKPEELMKTAKTAALT